MPDAEIKTPPQEVAENVDDRPEPEADAITQENAQQQVKKDALLLYRKECTQCKYLFDHEEKTYDECHFSQGNHQCPAATTEGYVGTDFDKASDGFVEALLDADPSRLGKICQKLKKLGPRVSERVFQMGLQKVVDISLVDGETPSQEEPQPTGS